MKLFRNMMKTNRQKTGMLLQAWLRPMLEALGAKLRLPARARIANAWARKHPRRTFALVFASLFLMLAANVVFEVGTEKNESEPGIIGITSMDSLFQGFRAIQANKGTHRQALMELTLRGQALRDELDSMIAMPRKTREDSVRIVLHYKQLEGIVNSLKTMISNDQD